MVRERRENLQGLTTDWLTAPDSKNLSYQKLQRSKKVANIFILQILTCIQYSTEVLINRKDGSILCKESSPMTPKSSKLD